MKLKKLVDRYGANCIIIIDAGNGCGGTAVLDISEEILEEYGDTEMRRVKSGARAYEADNPTSDTVLGAIRYAFADYEPENGKIWASDWIIDGTGDNPYRYRILF